MTTETTTRPTPTEQRTPTTRADSPCEGAGLTWGQAEAMASSYSGVTTLLVAAGVGLHKLAERDNAPELKHAYKILQDVVIRPVDARASDEAEEERGLPTTKDVNLDALPSETLCIGNGQVTPAGKLVIAKVAEDLLALCQRSHDPQAALQELPELTKHLSEIASRRNHVESSPLRTALTGLVGSECLERRPDRDPLTGERADGQPDTDDTWRDRLPCNQRHGHGGDHSDFLGRTWHRTDISA